MENTSTSRTSVRVDLLRVATGKRVVVSDDVEFTRALPGSYELEVGAEFLATASDEVFQQVLEHERSHATNELVRRFGGTDLFAQLWLRSGGTFERLDELALAL